MVHKLADKIGCVLNGYADIAIPSKLIPVFTGEADMRGAYGGRGSSKTMSFAKMTAIRAYMWDQAGREGVIVCAREKLNSLDDSSMAEVKSAIESEPWLREHFDIGEKYIRTKSGRIAYKFSGLDKKTVMSLKSKAKILLLWADEAEPITDSAWDIVIPTLRQEDSELWVTWNPARKSSATDRRFRQTKDPRFKVAEMNWRDNPRFPAILERQRLRWMQTDPDSYEHVWEGAYASAVKGAYFTKHLSAMRQDGRLGRVAADPNMKHRLFADIGGTGRSSDAFAMWGAQFIGREVRVTNYHEAVGQEVGFHLNWMREKGYEPNNTGIWLPHDGATHDKVYNVSYQSAFEAAGYTVEVVPNQGRGAAMARINAARKMFPAVWMNEETTGPGVEALGWYHEKRDDERDIGLGPEHDWASHGCFDGSTKVLTRYGTRRIMDLPKTGEVFTPCGWKQYIHPRITKRNALLVEVEFVGGYTVKCTPDHLFLTERGWKSAQSLMMGSVIRSSLMGSRSISVALSIACGRLTGISLKAVAGFIETLGKPLLGQFQQDVISTTEMAMWKTTSSKTWSALTQKNIYEFRARLGQYISKVKLATTLGRRPQSGTGHQMAESGIGAKLNDHKAGQNGNVNLRTALNVALSFLPSFAKAASLKCIAVLHVRWPLIASVVNKTSGPLRIAHVRHLNETADVWDVTVPDGHWFSLENGAVVHNSDAWGLMAVVAEEAMRPGSGIRRDKPFRRGSPMAV